MRGLILIGGLMVFCSHLLSPTRAVSDDAAHDKAATPDEHVALLEANCAESADARAERHAAKPLYDRLGGEERIHALTKEVVRLHLENEAIAHLFQDTDNEKVATRVAQFMVQGTGGPQAYDGPDLTTSHAHMKLTNADFVAAGMDIVQAMENLEYGQNEIEEVVCALVGLREQVVLPAEAAHADHDHGH